MKKQLSLAIVFLLMFAFTTALNMHAAKASPSVIIVPDQYSTIQAGIDHANDGDTVFVRSGTYYEHLIVDKSVTLEGESKDTTIIDGSYSGIVVNVTRNGVNVSGFKIQHSGNSWNIGGPPYSAGIFLSGTSYCSLYGNNIVSNGGIGVQAEYGASNNVIADNTIANDAVGIGTLNASWNIFVRNVVTGNGRGFGLNVDSDHNLISGNVITASEWVIALHMCHYNTLTDNYVANGQIGIYLPDSSYNQVYHNFIVNNLQQASLQGFPSHVNYWDDGYPSGGNHWSDYVGTDANGDGIGDTAYTIDANNVDRYPLMYSEVIVPYHFATIQEAINHANSGDRVLVKAGVYNEHVLVNRTVSLVGEDCRTTIIDGSVVGTVVTITQTGVSVSGFTIQHSGTAVGVGGPPLGDAGIFMTNVAHCTISENIVVENAVGIQLEEGADSNTIVNNTVSNNVLGVSAALAELNNVAQNRVENNSAFSIGLPWAAENNTVSDNYVTSPGLCAIYIDGSHYNNLFRNYVANSSAGVWIFRSSNNRIYHNTFVNNVQQVNSTSPFGDPPLFNYWDDGYPSGGNYWSDYTGVDVQRGPSQNQPGSDGIGDTPYVCAENNVDHYPLMEPYVMKSRVGDVNGDLIVDIFDAILLSTAYNSNPSSPKWNPNADFNGDNTVDIFDAILLAGAFGNKYT